MNTTKLKIDVGEMLKIYDRLAEIDAHKLSEIELIMDGEVIEISQDDINNWPHIGLSTNCYIKSRNFSKEIK